MITSISNAQVKQVCAYVQKAKERRKDGIFVVEGRKMFEEAPAERVYKVYATQSFCDKHIDDGIGAKLSATGYELVSEEGPDNAKIFSVRVLVNSNCFGTGRGSSKKEAEQNAAREALKLYLPK